MKTKKNKSLNNKSKQIYSENFTSKLNITFPGESITMENKNELAIPRLSDYDFLPTWLRHTILVIKHVLVSTIRYFSIEYHGRQ